MYGLNQFSGPSNILIKTALDDLIDGQKLLVSRTGKVEATDPVVFTQDGTSAEGKGAVVSSVIGGGGYFAKTTSELAPKKSIFKAAASPRITPIADFTSNLEIPRTFMNDQQQMAVSKSVQQETRSWLATRDRNSVNVYANGFTTQTTIDGATLFSNTHTNENGDTVDNLETAVLSDSGFNTVVNSLRTQINQSGVLTGYEPDFLLTPSILGETGMAVTKSVLRAGGGNNDLNYWSELYPGLKVVYSPFLDATSTTAYFVGSMGHSVIRYEREAFFTDLVPWQTHPNDMYIYKMRAREETDSITYDGLVGSNGTV